MIIHGFQKLTLLDFPTKTACTVFTGGCNLRCPFCHNAVLVLSPGKYPTVSEQEVTGIREEEIGKVFETVLTHAGVYKRDAKGMEAFDRFVATAAKD